MEHIYSHLPFHHRCMLSGAVAEVWFIPEYAGYVIKEGFVKDMMSPEDWNELQELRREEAVAIQAAKEEGWPVESEIRLVFGSLVDCVEFIEVMNEQHMMSHEQGAGVDEEWGERYQRLDAKMHEIASRALPLERVGHDTTETAFVSFDLIDNEGHRQQLH